MSDDKDGYLWGNSDMFATWQGAAHLDQKITIPAPSIEEAVGLDHDEWLTVGFEIGGGELDHDLHIYAVHRDLVPEGGDVFPKIAAANDGEIPVTEFLVHDVDPYAFLKAITHVFELRMRSVGSQDLPIRVISRGDLPDQG
ncbi:hypothetical protein [Herbiconiux sp. VKM Ac-2851]|uniref:hypothetical protein n=1 Tax=Herbiconiux sp. VKM Ac-2851 TaxID=2739025 RepID=UPI001567BB7C|nr:hypothetical protein [Herbiconiux sp. VKM Ac-2851]NQX35468.1 hypothetical protein [Herbiconiux sp. VKM Ac-2851]